MALLKLKKEFIGQRILKGSQVFELAEDLTQTELLYVKKFIDKNYIEIISDDSEEISELRIEKKKAKNYVKDTKESGE